MEDKMKISVLSKLAMILCLAICISLMVCACGSNNAGSNDNTPDEPTHTHVYVDNQCECGAFDPNFDPFAPDKDDKPDNSDKNTVTYTVTVVDQDGAPVVGVPVQLCDGDLCLTPRVTDANGVVVFDIEPADYSVKIPLPEYMGQVYYFNGSSTELTITITAN